MQQLGKTKMNRGTFFISIHLNHHKFVSQFIDV